MKILVKKYSRRILFFKFYENYRKPFLQKCMISYSTIFLFCGGIECRCGFQENLRVRFTIRNHVTGENVIEKSKQIAVARDFNVKSFPFRTRGEGDADLIQNQNLGREKKWLRFVS